MVAVERKRGRRKSGISKEEKSEVLGDHQRVDCTFVASNHRIQSQFLAFHRIVSHFVAFYRNFSFTELDFESADCLDCVASPIFCPTPFHLPLPSTLIPILPSDPCPYLDLILKNDQPNFQCTRHNSIFS